MTDATQDASLTASQTLSQTQRTKSPTYTRGAETSAGWGHWMGDGLATTDLASPRVRYSTISSRSGSVSPGHRRRLAATSLLDGSGSDRTQGCPGNEADKVWSKRSMKEMSDFGTVPSGLPIGISENEKKLWLAMYVKARDLLQDGSCGSVRQAVDRAIGAVAEKHSLEYRFGMRWSHSIKTCLAMRQGYRSSDVYS